MFALAEVLADLGKCHTEKEIATGIVEEIVMEIEMLEGTGEFFFTPISSFFLLVLLEERV